MSHLLELALTASVSLLVGLLIGRASRRARGPTERERLIAEGEALYGVPYIPGEDIDLYRNRVRHVRDKKLIAEHGRWW